MSNASWKMRAKFAGKEKILWDFNVTFHIKLIYSSDAWWSTFSKTLNNLNFVVEIRKWSIENQNHNVFRCTICMKYISGSVVKGKKNL